MIRHPVRLLACLVALCASPARAMEPPPYPGDGPLSAMDIAIQTHTAMRGGLVKTAVSRRNGKSVAMLINRAPLANRKKHAGRKPGVNTFETYVNNAPQDPAVRSRQLAIFMSGKVKGTGVLITNYTAKDREPDLTLWFPALRKLKTLKAPDHADTWGGSIFTYGELVLRRPEHEEHELLGEGVMDYCLPVMELEKSEKTRHTKHLPEPQCGHKGKPIYHLKSSTKFHNWWYDYHVSDIDKKTFSLYRTVYYKGDRKVKTVVIDWQSLDQPDPRIAWPRYVYAVMHADGKDSLIYVPRETIFMNEDIPDSFWSTDTLRKQGRSR